MDPGLGATGWGVVRSEGDRLRLLASGVLASDPKLPLSMRLQEIFTALSDAILMWSPAEMAVEDQFVGRDPRAAIALGQARAAALLAAAQSEIEVHHYSPAQVKQSVSGYGRSDKKQVQEMVRLQLGLAQAPEPADVADALAVAICHLAHRRVARRINGHKGGNHR